MRWLTFLFLLVTPLGSAAAPALSGTWVLQQASSPAELARLEAGSLGAALQTPAIRGFCLRFPWRAADRDFALLEAGLKIARNHKLDFSVRFMAGRHTPARVFDAGCRYYLSQSSREKVPVPFLEDGAPNPIFEREYEAYVKRLATWCRAHGVRLLHLAWYGQEWAELNHGAEVRALKGYSFANWLTAHRRLIDIGLCVAGDDLAVEFPFSGHGPLTDAAPALARHVIAQAGPDSPRFYCQANGWGPGGEWGAPTAATEAAFDRVWTLPIRRGLQMIQPRDYDWPALFKRLADVHAAYCEVYAPSFTMAHQKELVEEIRKFAVRTR